MKKYIFKIFLTLLLLISVSGFAKEKYAVVKLQGAVNPVVAEYLVESMKKAVIDDAQFIVMLMDTPGGLMTSMRDIIKQILNSKIPVIVYTYPKGGQAASAGGFIMLSSHIAVMSPGTEIGAMHPVSPMLDFMKKDKKGGPAGVMEKKVLNDTVAYARSLAQKRKRNVKWSVKAVEKAISSTYKEALKLNIIDFIAEDMNDLLKKLDKRKLNFNGKKFIFHTKNITPITYELTGKQKLLNYFADPQIIFILFIVAIAGIGIEFKSPGMIIPGTIGAISFFIFLMAIQIIPINIIGLILILLAIVLFILELSIMSYGLLTIGGIISFMLGSMILFDSPLQGGGIPLSSIIGAMIVLMGFIFLVVRAIINTHKEQVTTGNEGLINAKGRALKNFSGKGKVFIHGEIWNAFSNEEILKDDDIIVTEVKGMILNIKKINT